MPTCARDIVVDHGKHEIRIEGVVFPFYVEKDPEVVVIDGAICVLRIGVYADDIHVLTGQRQRRRHLSEMDKAWVNSTLNNIVEETLSDTLAWLRAVGRPV